MGLKQILRSRLVAGLMGGIIFLSAGTMMAHAAGTRAPAPQAPADATSENLYALVSFFVDGSTTFDKQSHAVSARVDPGPQACLDGDTPPCSWLVKFDRDVSQCVYTTTSVDTLDTTVQIVPTLRDREPDPTEARVFEARYGTSPRDFLLVITC